jgi:hypothetical protein
MFGGRYAINYSSLYIKSLGDCQSFHGFALIGVMVIALFTCIVLLFFCVSLYGIKSALTVVRTQRSIPVGKLPLFDTPLFEGQEAVRRGWMRIGLAVVSLGICFFCAAQIIKLSDTFLVPVNSISKCQH